MTENKRFKYSYSLEKVYDCDSFNGETTESYGTFECCDLLNKLNDENKELKQIIAKDTIPRLMNGFEKSYKDLEEENDELKKILGFLRNDNATDILNVLNSQENQIWELKKENEQLKHECNYLQNRLDDFVNIQNENEQLKKILNELSDMLQFDVENGIRSYPVKLSEYLSNALKELKE